MNQDQISGRIKQAQGSVTEIAGKVTGRALLRLKGTLQKTEGRAQADYGDIKQKCKNRQLTGERDRCV